MAAPTKFSNGCQSDNFDPRRSAYGPFESLCPKFSETHAGKVSIFKIVGARPLRSQVIRKSCTQNSCFFRQFLSENALSRPSRPFFTHSVIHIQKAEHLTIPKIRLKLHFRHHVKRQICGDALQLIWRVDLKCYRKHFSNWTWSESLHFTFYILQAHTWCLSPAPLAVPAPNFQADIQKSQRLHFCIGIGIGV